MAGSLVGGDHADPVDALVDGWCKQDHARALLPGDHDVVEATRTLRALIVEGITGAVAQRDLLHACWRLGHLIATRGGSPTLLGSTLDGAHSVTQGDARTAHPAHPWVSMRAAASEGFAAARADLARSESVAAWDYPFCAVRIDAESVAVAGGYPDDDAAAIEVWAGRVAQSVARAGFRRAFVSGRVEVRRALEDALSFVGVGLVPADGDRVASPAENAETGVGRRFFGLWKRSPK